MDKYYGTERIVKNKAYFGLHINGILLLSIHVGITVVTLESSEELLGLGCCLPLTSPLRKYLFNTIIATVI